MHTSGSGRGHLRVPAAAFLSAVAALAAALALAAAFITWTDVQPSRRERAPVAAATVQEAATPVVLPRRTKTPLPSTPQPGTGAPRRVLIDSLGVDAPVIAVVTQGRTLDPPADPQVLGWWSGGSKPGDVLGSALVTGHTVHDGGGALDELEQIRPGALITVHTANGVVRYRAENVDVLDKGTIARQAPRLFSQEVPGRLVLVTCEDWDGTGYRSNVVVTASVRS